MSRVHTYVSPVLATLALLEEKASEDGSRAAVFTFIPLSRRSSLRRYIKTNFKVREMTRVKVSYDRLIMPNGKVATGVRVTPQI